MPRGRGYGSSHGAHSRQFGIKKGGGRRKSGGKVHDKVYDMQMKDASNGRQRYFNREGD
jgi:hypothetical protein